MDRLLDYGDLGALVRAGFSSPSPSSPPFPVSANPTSDLSFPGFHSPLSPSFQLPSLSTAFDALDSLPSAAPSHFSLPRLNYSAPVPMSAGFSPPAYSSFASSTSVFSPNSLSSASFRKLDRRVDSSDFACPFADVATPDLHCGMSMASSAVSLQSLRDQPLPLSALRRIVAEEEKLTGAKSSRSGPCPPSRAPETQNTLERSDEIYPSNFSRSFLYPLLADQELTAISTASASTEKRAAETELSSTATADNQNRARGTKRSRKLMQKRVVHIPAVGGMSSKPSAGENVPSDMWAWRKYGQKPIKGSPHPRGYYRCSSSKGCPARKQVERNPTDPSMLVVTYTSEHNHTWPTHRINALAGSTRPPLTKSPPSPSGANVHSPNCDTSNSPLSVDMEDGPSPSPLSLDDTLLDDDLTMCKAGCQDLDATKFNATSPPSSITSAPPVIHNVVNAAKPVLPSSVWSAVKSDPDTVNTGHASCTFPATSAPLTIHNVANADTSTDLRSLHASFRVRNADIKTENSDAMMSTYSTTTTLQMVHNGSNVGATFSGHTASQASRLGRNAVIPNAMAASTCAATLPASVVARNAVKPEAGLGCVAETAQQEGGAFFSCVEEEAQLFDTLLSEMLEEVQRQNREVMGEEDEEALLFKWSNNINFLSQVNHLVQ